MLPVWSCYDSVSDLSLYIIWSSYNEDKHQLGPATKSEIGRGVKRSDEWAQAGGWSWSNEGGRYLGCCWNLVPPTDNYRAVCLLVTTAVAAYLWIGPESTPKSPHTHADVQARALSWRQEPEKKCGEEFLPGSLKVLYHDYRRSSVIGLWRLCKQCLLESRSKN